VRITRLTFAKLRLPFRKPFVTARGTLSERETFILALHDCEGRVGIGEAAPLLAFGGESASDAEAMLSSLAQQTSFPACEASAEGITQCREAMGMTTTTHPITSFGVECALLSLAAQEGKIRAAELFGVPDIWHVKAYALIGGENIFEIEPMVADSVDQGFTALKLKVGFRGGQTEIDILRELHHLYPSCRWRADANGAWNIDETEHFLTETADCKLSYVEDPVKLDQLSELQRLPARWHAKIAFDEPIANAVAADFVEAYSPAAVILKPALLGSFARVQEWSRAVRGRETRLIVTSFLESSVGLCYNALCAQMLNARFEMHGLATAALLARDTVKHPFRPVKGRLAVPDARHITDKLNEDLRTLLRIA
jgi:L-Ala-D/L-Glu epimerase